MISANAKWAVATPLYATLLSLGAMGIAAPAAAQEASPFDGFYVGVNAGVTWGDSQSHVTLTATGGPPAPSNPIVIPPSDITTINSSASFNAKHHTGFTGGIEAGYNYVLHGGFMVGIETDLDIFDITGNRTSSVTGAVPAGGGTAPVYTLSQSVDTDFLWTLRPRIGYATGDFLIFGSAGLALTTTKYKAHFTDSADASNNVSPARDSNSKTGWTIGAGFAYAITPNISLKGEYMFEDFGHSNFHGTSSSGVLSYDADVHLKSHLFRAGLDYRF